MQAAELAAEFGSAGILDFVETEHGLVKAAISLTQSSVGVSLPKRPNPCGMTCSTPRNRSGSV